MKVLKFGGKSLANGEGIQNVISIIKNKNRLSERVTIVVSARGKTTDWLEHILEKARNRNDYQKDWKVFQEYQIQPCSNIDYRIDFELLESIFERVKLDRAYDALTKDLVLAQGEILSAKLLSKLLTELRIPSLFVDSRRFFITDNEFGNANINEQISRFLTQRYFKNVPKSVIPIVTGFIASSRNESTTTLGRNGSNYSASLLAKYLKVKGVESYTHVDGVFTADPKKVLDAKLITKMSFEEAHNIAKSDATILHEKTILPLSESNIPLQILNSFNLKSRGTYIG